MTSRFDTVMQVYAPKAFLVFVQSPSHKFWFTYVKAK